MVHVKFYLQLMQVHRQSGDRVNCLTQELDMETTSITTTSTELQTLDNKMIDISEVHTVFPRDFMGPAEGSVDLIHPTDISETAFFDVQLEPSVDSGRGLLPFKNTEGLSLSSSVSNMVDSVLPSERPTLSMFPCVSSMVDRGLSSEGLPCVSGMVDSVLSSERPISPSDFLQENPVLSSPLQTQGSEFPPELLDQVCQLLAETPENITGDSIQQLDLTLFSHCDEQDTLDNIMQECGILDEIKEVSHVQCERDGPNLTVKEESHVHCKGDMLNFRVPTTIIQPLSNQSDYVGPVRTRQIRRNCRKPVRYRMTKHLDEEPATTEVPVNTGLDDLMASTSSSTLVRTKENDFKKLSDSEKHKRTRQQNNLASKRCRAKRKDDFKKMEMEVIELKKRNRDLQDKVANLTELRDNFKDFVNKFLFQRMTMK